MYSYQAQGSKPPENLGQRSGGKYDGGGWVHHRSQVHVVISLCTRDIDS